MPVRKAPNEEPLPGFRLVKQLGRGGFGEVWEAIAPGDIRKAIKFVFGDLDSDDEDGRPAAQELKALKRIRDIRHPYILTIEQYKVVDGELIIVMELADKNLWDQYRHHRGLGRPGIPRDELLGYMDEAAEALDLMNEKYKIQHLDVKPQNLFLVYNHVKVADFGLAKDFDGMRGEITGGVTPVYAGPETFEGEVSRYTDQYSLGIVFQELLTGTRPFNAANTKQLMMQHLYEPPALDPLPPADRDVIGRALAKKPENRWPSCRELVRALKQAGVAVPDAPIPVGPKPRSGPQPVPTARAVPRPSGVQPMVLPPLVAPGGSDAIRTTPRPALVTPRLVTPGGSGSSLAPAATMLKQQLVVQTARMSSLGLAPPERDESGILMPALLVGVGGVGLAALTAFRRLLRERFGPDAAPHVRCVYIDTDPDAALAAASPDNPDRLAPHQIVVARLNRPSHYLQSGASPEGWLPPGALYKLPRNPAAADGVRAFGRLALVDHYRLIAQRVRTEVEGFLTDDPLDQAAAATGLGVRSNRARVYLFAGLAGGTGAGMFLDLAFVVKNELRQIGYIRPQVTGVLFVPPADVRGPGLANAHAALTELGHFHGGRNRYTAKLDPGEPAVSDGDGPFARTVLLPLPRRQGPDELAKAAGVAARAAYLDLFTPVGRATDAVRAEALALNRDGTPVVQPVGLYRLTWPREELLNLATARFAQRVLSRWAAKDAAHLREPLRDWLAGEWTRRNLELDHVVGRFDAAVRDALKEEPDRVFDAFVEPLRMRGSGGGRLDAEAAVSVLEQLIKLVGKPDAENDRPGSLHAALAEAQAKATADIEADVAAMVLWPIEQPQYRLAGAEELLAQLDEKLRAQIEGLEGVRANLDWEVRDCYARLFPVIGGLSAATGLGAIGARKSVMVADLLELLAAYPRKRLRLLVLDATLSLYRGLRAAGPDFVRDVGLFRNRLTETANGLTATAPPPAVGPGRMILPHGVEGLDGAADQFIGSLAPQDIVAFDQAVQVEVKKRFKRLADVCLAPARLPDLRSLVVAQARAFLDAKLERTDPAAVLYRYRADDAKMTKMLCRAFEEAAPGVGPANGVPPTEATTLAVPVGPDGDRLRQDVEHLFPTTVFLPAALPDDIAFVREYPLLPLADLPHLGAAGREAFDARAAAAGSPHARADVAWSSVGGGQ